MTKLELVAKSGITYCQHGINDDMEQVSVDTTDGPCAKIKRYRYYCPVHSAYGSYALTEIK